MLAGCVGALVSEGWHVVVPSRRHVPIPEPRAHEGEPGGRAIWVAADWSDPDGLVERARRALHDSADLLVAWLPAGAGAAVLDAVGGLLRPAAPVVEVHDARSDPQAGSFPEPGLPGHPTQQVVLGCVRAGGCTRRLTSQEVTNGVLTAMRRAVQNRGPLLHQVGEPHPWLLR